MLNTAAIMGRLAADPELKHTPSGVAVTSFTLAVDRNYAKPGEERQTDWIDVVAWRGTAEFICKPALGRTKTGPSTRRWSWWPSRFLSAGTRRGSPEGEILPDSYRRKRRLRGNLSRIFFRGIWETLRN